jgi:hypothetical protein
MPFISQKDTRELTQGFTPYQESFDPSFGEVFAASVGQVFDEELSISGGLNREGWRERTKITRDILDADSNLNRQDYIDRRGRFDYNRFAEDSGDDRVKTDQQLEVERRELLESRRNYANDVIERGSGMAQFLGMATGYMLDPINIATMGVGSSVGAAKAATTIGRAMAGAKEAALIGSATELAIQPLVYEHKSDIGSPYSAQDAIEAIAGAAIGGAAIGAFTGGLSGYIRSIRKAADNLPETGDIQQAKESLLAMEQTLQNAPNKTIEGEAAYLRELEAQKAISDAPSRTPEQYDIPEEVLDEPGFDVVNEVSIDGDTFSPDLAIGRQSEMLDSLGLKDDFDRDMQSFSQIESPKAIMDGELVDAADLMKGFDEELDGINSVLVCTRG